MKIAIITDTHWGVRNDNALFYDYTKKFLDDVFFPLLDADDIKTVIHLGDLVDRRKYINFNTAKRLREDFMQPLAERNIDYHQILGNHDVYFKNTNDVNAISELYNGIHRYETAAELTFDDTKILFIPWICQDNRDKTLDLLRKTDAQIAMGHLELQGFEMFKGSISTHGDDVGLFDKFDTVLSGHYHHKSSTGNIHYLGSHSEFTWSDYDDDRGFHVFDTETRALGFIRNPYQIFKKIWYNDTNIGIDFVAEYDYSQYKDKIVKVIVQNKTNPYWFDMFIDNLEKANPSQVQIVEDHLNLNMEDDGDIVQEAEDTMTIFKKYIDQINTRHLDKDKLERVISNLYNEALSVE